MTRRSSKTSRLWGKAFTSAPDKAALTFTAGRDVHPLPAADSHLIPYDLWVNRAHCMMLFSTGIIDREDAQTILKGLNEIEVLAQDGKFPLDPQKEDVHTNIESFLIEKYGIQSVGKLHTARSRNDQVVTDMRLYIRDALLLFAENTSHLVSTLLIEAEKYKATAMPGFTHRQHAMITTFGHLLLSYASMLERDTRKFLHSTNIVSTNPLGSAASFGTSFPIDRDSTTAYFGFLRADVNSLDAITNRWEPESDLAYAVVSLMNHLSILAESFITMTTPEFGMITLSEQFSTGSSIMPQKKNPDTLEVIKGKASYAHGALMSLVSTGKAAFSGYNRDSQWTKYIVMDLVGECISAPVVTGGIVQTLKIDTKVMLSWTGKNFIGATSLLEIYCATFNIPFRVGKMVVETAIKYSTGRDSIDYEALAKACSELGVTTLPTKTQVRQWQEPSHILEAYVSSGSPGITSFDESHSLLTAANKINVRSIEHERSLIASAHKKLERDIQKVLKS